MDVESRLARLETQITMISEDISEVKNTQKEIRDLEISVNTLATKVDRLCSDICVVNKRVAIIDQKPGKRWDLIITIAITAIVTFAINSFIKDIVGGIS